MLFRQIMRYLSVGLVNTLVGLSLIWSLMFLGLHPLVANAAGYGVGMVIAFFLNREWTFQVAARSGQATRYIISFLISYGINIAVLISTISFFESAGFIAQPVAIAAYSVSFFLISKHYVFRDA